MNNIFKNVFKNRKVLVTGHTGFKGSWLCLWLHEMGADVLGYSLAPEGVPNLYETLGLNQKIKSITGDIRDEDSLKNAFYTHQPEVVFHLAAQPLVRLSYKNPKYTYETNIMGTINMLEAVRETPSVKAVVNVTSDKCYENKEWVYGYREQDPMGGYDPYSSSKGAVEIITSAYRNSFFTPSKYNSEHTVALASARAGNVIGGGDWSEDRLVPDCIRSLSLGMPVTIRNPESVRPWQYVLEPISGYLHLASCLYLSGSKYADSWNFGPHDNDVLTVRELTQLLIKSWGQGEYKVISDSRLHEAGLLRLDISKASSLLNWNPVYTVDIAIEETSNWYKAYYQKENMYEYSVYQLEKYITAATQKNLNWSPDTLEKIPDGNVAEKFS